MTFSSDKEIERIYLGIIARTLPKSEWTHEAHFAAAVAMLTDKNQNAFEAMPDVIKAYNLATGVANTDTDGYHHTITLASLMMAKLVMDKYPKDSALFKITNTILNLEFGKSSWMLDHWSEAVLFSVNARHNWTEPDIRPLPII